MDSTKLRLALFLEKMSALGRRACSISLLFLLAGMSMAPRAAQEERHLSAGQFLQRLPRSNMQPGSLRPMPIATDPASQMLGGGMQDMQYAPSGSNGDLDCRPDRILVAFNSGLSWSEKQSSVEAASPHLFLDPIPLSPYFERVNISGQGIAAGFTVEQAIERLQHDPRVRIAEPDYVVRTLRIPNDPQFSELWGLHNTGSFFGYSKNGADIDAPDAWDLTTGSSTVVVAVIDTGVDYNHQDLTANILRDSSNKVVGYDYANTDDDPMDDHGHGTHVSGTIGAVGNNGIGVAGVCWNVKIMPLKFLSAGGSGYISNAIPCVDFAITHGAHVMSNSWGGGGFSSLLLDAIKRAEAAGIAFVAAAGNSALNNDVSDAFPASYNRFASNVISVGATDYFDNLASFSNYGSRSVDIAAPGVYTYSTYPGNRYVYMSGTSMATPHVSGAYALVKSLYPSASPQQIKARLLYSADKLESITGYTRTGRLNVFAALENDTISPGAPQNLLVTHSSANGFKLNWVASGENGGEGGVSAYEISYGSSADLASAASCTFRLAPGGPGTSETYVLTGLLPNTPYYLGLRALDNVGNKSSTVIAGPVRTQSAYFFDDVESTPRFSGQTGTTWAVTAENSHSGRKSYTDSPGSNYPSGYFDSSLTMIDSVLVTKPMAFRFWAKTDLDLYNAYLYVEVSVNGGSSWAYTGYLTGTMDWSEYIFYINDYLNMNLEVRFRLVSYGGTARDGVWLDDIQFIQLNTIFLDNAEGAAQFTGLAPWAITNEKGFSPSHAYSDSPGGGYANNRQSPLIQNNSTSVGSFDSCVLNFKANLDLEQYRD